MSTWLGLNIDQWEITLQGATLLLLVLILLGVGRR